jgi:hypothetical protein
MGHHHPSISGRVLVALVVGLAACGSGATGSSTPFAGACGAGGTADESAYAVAFTNMALVDETTGQVGAADPDGGVVFPAAASLALRADTIGPVAVRACVQVRGPENRIVADQSADMAAGHGGIRLGPIPPGSYVVRVIVAGTLVRNFPFVTR